jgi:hypothetical protein
MSTVPVFIRALALRLSLTMTTSMTMMADLEMLRCEYSRFDSFKCFFVTVVVISNIQCVYRVRIFYTVYQIKIAPPVLVTKMARHRECTGLRALARLV